MKILTALVLSLLLIFTPLAYAGRNVTAQTFSSTSGTVNTGNDDRSVILIASGATVATIMGVSVTMVAGEVIPINAQAGDSLRSFSITVASGALICIEIK